MLLALRSSVAPYYDFFNRGIIMRIATPLRPKVWGLCALLGFVFTLLGSTAFAENNQVITVPFSQQNPNLPHPAHEGAYITL